MMTWTPYHRLAGREDPFGILQSRQRLIPGIKVALIVTCNASADPSITVKVATPLDEFDDLDWLILTVDWQALNAIDAVMSAVPESW